MHWATLSPSHGVRSQRASQAGRQSGAGASEAGPEPLFAEAGVATKTVSMSTSNFAGMAILQALVSHQSNRTSG